MPSDRENGPSIRFESTNSDDVLVVYMDDMHLGSVSRIAGEWYASERLHNDVIWTGEGLLGSESGPRIVGRPIRMGPGRPSKEESAADLEFFASSATNPYPFKG